MDGLSFGLFAFVAGLTLSGLSGSVLELVSGCRLSLGAPFVRPDRLGQMLLRTTLAGPLMLVNEALAAWRKGLIGVAMVAGATAAAGVWAFAQGVILVSLAKSAVALLG